MTVVRCYAGNQLVECIAALAPRRPRDLDHQFAVAHGHFRGLAVAGTDFIGKCFWHSQCEAVAPLLKCHLHVRSPTLMIQCRYALDGSWSIGTPTAGPARYQAGKASSPLQHDNPELD